MAKQFGQQVRQSRRKAGLGLRELARRSRLSAAYLSRIERGLVPTPSDEKVVLLANALGYDSLRFIPLAKRMDRLGESGSLKRLSDRVGQGYSSEIQATAEMDVLGQAIHLLQEAIVMGLQHGDFEFSIRAKKKNGDGTLTLNLGRIHHFTIQKRKVRSLDSSSGRDNAFLQGRTGRLLSEWGCV